MERKDLNDLVANSGLDLEVITTTTGLNGYPESLKKAVIGFENYEQAYKFAKENKLELIRVQRKFGSDLWNRLGTAFSALERNGSEFGDDYTVYDPTYYYDDQEFSEDKFYEKTVRDIIGEMETFDQARDLLDGFENVSKALSVCDDDELVLCSGSYDVVETIQKHCMQYSYDSMSYAIAAIKPGLEKLSINTLDDLVDYINSDDFNQLLVNDIIKDNNWKDESFRDDYSFCSYDGKIVVLDGDNGKAIIQDL